MGDAGRINSCGSHFAVHSLSLFDCCCCHGSKHEPLQLKCLHYYCRSCFDLSCNRMHVTCPACSEVTEISHVLTNYFLSTYKRASSARAEIVWCSTCEKNEQEETAEVWCADCTEALCHACYMQHTKFTNGHRVVELELARTLPLNHLTRTAQCSVHTREIEAHCVTCSMTKCIECLESCRVGGHDWYLLSDEKCREHISALTVETKNAAQQLGSILLGMLQKCRAIASYLQRNRTCGQRMLVEHCRLLRASTLRVFDNSVRELRSGLENIRYERPDIVTTGLPRNRAADIHSLELDGLRNLQFLNVRTLFTTVASCCCSSARASSIRFKRSLKESGSFSIYGSVSLTSDIVLGACLGWTDHRRAAVRAPLQFRETSVTFRTPVACWDLAATRDGHVLLAALEHGLLVYNDRGQQLSSWQPKRWSNGKDDGVSSVAMLSDGLAAVSLVRAQHIVLLKCSVTGDTWLEHCLIAELQLPPRRLAVCGDYLAATLCRPDEQQPPQMWPPGSEVKLLRLSCGRLLYTHVREYEIQNVALTALCVITTSLDTLKLSSGCAAYVIDAFSHSGGFMWRYKTSAEELLWGLCVSAETWSQVYVTMRRRDRSSRVMAIGATDGRDSMEVMSSRTHGLQLPAELSLARGQQRSILAVLSWVEENEELRTVSLYEASS